ncbi:MAG TPA: hypothetical protein LFW20_05285 [Rickettsia endosymbiont of Omalisus fontisbellaquei]|nr:hypothetical protein [Rickettsia endosymbiont of Omalisus fontisbellaquei]
MAENDDNIKKNVEAKLADLKSRIKDVNSQSAADSLIGEFNSLAIEAQGVGIEIDTPNIEASIQAKAQAKNVTNAIDKMSDQDQKLQYEEALKQEEERAKKVGKIYKEFHAISPEYLKQQKDRNKNLDEALKATESGQEISEELKAKFKKTPKEIEEETEKWEKIHNARTTAQVEHEHHSSELKKIDEDLSKLNPKTHPDAVEALNTKRAFHVEQQKIAKTEIDETAKHYEERGKEAEKIIKGQQKAKTTGHHQAFWDDHKRVFEDIHKIPPEIARHPIKVIEQADKIKKELKKDSIKSKNKDKEVQAQGQAKAQNQDKTHEQNNKKVPSKTNKNTQRWGI